MVGSQNNDQHAASVAGIRPVANHGEKCVSHKSWVPPSMFATFGECGIICQTPASRPIIESGQARFRCASARSLSGLQKWYRIA
jgi:hypothetical protein